MASPLQLPLLVNENTKKVRLLNIIGGGKEEEWCQALCGEVLETVCGCPLRFGSWSWERS